MTKIGIENLKDRIINRTIDPPQDLTIQELTAWLNGHAKCQIDILEIIESLTKEAWG